MSRLQVKQYAQEKTMLTNVCDTIRDSFTSIDFLIVFLNVRSKLQKKSKSVSIEVDLHEKNLFKLKYAIATTNELYRS